MDKATEILKRVRRIELKARRMASETFAGGYQSSFKGQGIDFDDLREYVAGDEPRFIDWKVTARMGSPYVRKFREDRELSLMLVVDISGSMHYGSQTMSKLEYAAELAAVLAFSAQHTGDKCGLLLFDSEPRLFLPPAKGYRQVLRIVREILEAPSLIGASSLVEVSSHLLRTLRKRSLVILLSDFLFALDNVSLGKMHFKHEVLPLRIHDPAELILPMAGNVVLKDPETNQLLQVNLNNRAMMNEYARSMQIHRADWQGKFNQFGMDTLSLSTEDDYISSLSGLFRKKTQRRNR